MQWQSALLVVLYLTSQTQQQCLTPADDVRRVSEAAVHSLHQSELRFSADLLRAVTTLQEGQNVVFSPASVFRALLMAYFISANHTEQSLRSVLHLPDALDKLDVLGAYTLDNYYGKLREISSSNYTLSSATRVYVAKQVHRRPCMGVLFSEEIQRANFRSNVEGVRRKLNQWVADKTRHVIRDFFKVDQLSSATELVLVNAAYFKGSWKLPFDPEETRERDFHLGNGTVVKTTMMTAHNAFKMIVDEELEAYVVELEYSGGEVSLFCAVPLDPSSSAVRDLLSRLNAESIREAVREVVQSDARPRHATLPKFTVDEFLDLVPVLESMGVGDLFDSSADLTTLTGRRDRGLSFSEAAHQARLSVDEAGTEAAAVTALISSRIAVDNFVADSPFVYFLYDKVTDTVLFVGVYESP